MAKSENWRSRLVNFVLYPDDDSHVKAIEYIRTHFHYVLILHDKDVNDDGELKKPHYHGILKFAQARWRSAIADEIGIAPNYLEKTGCWESSAAYLIHFGSDDKYQYDSSLLEGDLAPAVVKLTNPLDENARVLDIVDIIDNFPDYLPMTTFVRLLCKEGLWSDGRRMGQFAVALLNEHNERWVLKRREDEKRAEAATKPFGGPTYY